MRGKVHSAAALGSAVKRNRRGDHPAGPASTQDRLLDLQRRAGNRATCALVGGQAPREVQRSIGVSAAQLASLRTGNALTRTFGSSTFDKLVSLRKRYDRAKDQPNRLFYADAIAGVCDHWLATHGRSASKADLRRRPVVEDLQAHALRAASKIRAEVIYMKEMEGGGLEGIGALTRSNALGPAKGLAKGKTSKGAGADDAAAALAAEHKLTAAEIAAIRVYTLPDYTYINPATANADGWMKSRIAGANDMHSFKKVHQKVLKSEGALHAGMLMQALGKLPPWKGLTYRGSRMTPEKFKAEYSQGATSKFTAFGSSAKIESAARKFADGVGGDVSPSVAETVSVMAKVTLTNGRDISSLSAAMVKEDEVLILPGATFAVTNIERHPTGAPGAKAAPATAWFTVHLTQTA